jgi:hypothetical protein
VLIQFYRNFFSWRNLATNIQAFGLTEGEGSDGGLSFQIGDVKPTVAMFGDQMDPL